MTRVEEVAAGTTTDVRPDERTPAVSVLIPAYNVSQYIGETLASVFAQTFKDFEVIVVNDGSPDTPELERVLAPYRERVRYIVQENRGVSAARNAAIRAARAPLLALLDPDDAWEPDYLAVQLAEMERDPTIDVLYPNAVFFGDVPEDGQDYMTLCPSEGEVSFESLTAQRCQVMVSVMARRETVVAAGMFDEGLRSCEDFDLWLRIVRRGGRIAYHRQKLVRYRRRAGSLSSDPVWMSEHVLKVLEKVAASDLTPDERGAVEEAVVRYETELNLHTGKRAFFRGDTTAAVEHLRRANAVMHSRKLSLVVMGLRLAPRLLRRLYDFRDRHVVGVDTKF